MTTNEQKIPIWFWIVAAILVIWNLMGIMNFLSQATMSQEDINALSELEKSMMERRPSWVYFAFGLAVFGGLAGSIALLLKKKIATTLFIASLVGVAFQFGESIIASPAEVFTTAVIGITTMIIVLALFAIWFAKYATKKGWLS